MPGYLLPIAIGAGTMAKENPYLSAAQNDAYAVAYAGGYNVFADNDITDGDKTVVIGGEYRFRNLGYGFRPVIGGHGNFKGDFYGYAGFVVDVPLYQDRIWFIPGAAVGAFAHG